MSGPATALAYKYDVDEQQTHQTASRLDYRLLGGVEPQLRPAPVWNLMPPLRNEVRRPDFLVVLDEPELEPQAHFQHPQRRRPQRIAHPRWLLGAFLGIAALAAVVSPVFATGSSEAKVRSLKLSSYAGPQQPTEGLVAPVIDTTTRPIDGDAPPQEAAQSEPAAAGSYELTAPPSLSVQLIESVLKQYGSPASGTGQTLYDLGVRYGIDPAYALAFFVHESACGTKGVARVTKSLGNIRWTEGYRDYEGYRSYDSWEQGMEDWYRLITELYISGWNLRTVDEIIPVYAPWGDNNHPPTYIASVKAMVDSWRGK